MTNPPDFGDKVRVWPVRANVQAGAGAYGKFLTGPADVTWDAFWQRRLMDGDVALHPTTKKDKE